MDAKKSNRSVLIYEPSVDGHHVGWLRFITEDLLGAGFALTLALDTRPAAMKRIEGQMADLLPRVRIIPAIAEKSDEAKITSPAHVAACLEKSGAALAFLANFNDVASALLRRAAFGLMPDASLRGRFGGIYFRPLFINASGLSPNQALKKLGFRRLVQNGWLNPLLMIDPLLCGFAQKKYPGVPIHLLADPYPENFDADRAASRKQFNLPDDKFVFLFYGGGYQRKGLHLAVEAMLKMSAPGRTFLLCAGLQPKNEQLARDLETLRSQGRAEIVNRYVSVEEEKQLFAACDAVLLPYIRHRDGSGVLSRAAGAGKPAIASDEYLIGHVVRQYGMGLLFESGNVPELQNAIARAASANAEELSKWQAGAQAYAKNCSRDAFRSALVAAVEAALAAQK
ncbi:MAG TPA: glycosyltransferase [Candidatus Limnocylindrales bacterium]|nr:glycosyltransferase [Candidatus Limnocylindrales bacterium]